MSEASSIRPLSDYDFSDAFETRFAKAYYLKAKQLLICELKAEYVPIAHFRDTFHQLSGLVESGSNQKFIFDKRALRAFHQPSMEWYYLVWKRDMLAHGLRVHRKILPTEAWFQKSVMIAREQIHHQHPENIIDQLDIRYCDSIEEAIVL